MSESKSIKGPVSLQTYQRLNGEVFPTEESLRWFIRRHRSELVQSGALVIPNGRKLAVVERFDQTVQAIGERRAKAYAE